MTAWAARARGFSGVAPGTSPRLYIIPKAGASILPLPLAIVKAVADGADVVLCATYVEGTTSPMLDDALEFATRFGRHGRGSAVVMPTGREASSAAGSVHASFSLGFGDPASDPRVFCVAPGARGGGWFLYRDKQGKSRPFANRGPAIRWLSPGDDIAYPFTRDQAKGRLYHAESSGAAAIAAGTLLLVLSTNPRLRLGELESIVTTTASTCPSEALTRHEPLADPLDALPGMRDQDGHDAKGGYGQLNAGRACLAASDPVCFALLMMGEEKASLAYADLRRADTLLAHAYPRRLGRWMVRVVLADAALAHSLRSILRHLRLIGTNEQRRRLHGDGALLRQLRLLLRRCKATRVRPSPLIDADLDLLIEQVRLAADGADRGACLERAIAERVGNLF
jgi:hypothetical protein